MRESGFPDLTYAAEKTVPAVVYIDKTEVVEAQENQFSEILLSSSSAYRRGTVAVRFH